MSKAQDTMTYLEIGAALVAGYVAYKALSKASEGVAAVAGEVKTVITHDLNPASPDNVIYSHLPQSLKDGIQNVLDKVLGTPGNSGPHNVAPTVAPTQNTDNQAQAETQRLVRKATADASTGQSAIGYTDSQQITQAIPINFGIIDPSTWN